MAQWFARLTHNQLIPVSCEFEPHQFISSNYCTLIKPSLMVNYSLYLVTIVCI